MNLNNQLVLWKYILIYNNNQICGIPPKYLLEQSSRTSKFFDENGNPYLEPNSRGKRRKPNTLTLENALKCNDEMFVDLIARCIDYDPEKRITPEV